MGEELHCRKCHKVIFEPYDLAFLAELNNKECTVILHLCGLCYHTIRENYYLPKETVPVNVSEQKKIPLGRVCPKCGRIFQKPNGKILHSEVGDLLICKYCHEKELANGR